VPSYNTWDAPAEGSTSGAQRTRPGYSPQGSAHDGGVGGSGSAVILFMVAMGLVGYVLLQRARNRTEWSSASTPAHAAESGFPAARPRRNRKGLRPSRGSGRGGADGEADQRFPAGGGGGTGAAGRNGYADLEDEV